VWATLTGAEIPDRLPPPARTVLEDLTWHRKGPSPRPGHWTTTLRDPPRHGAIRGDVRARVRRLRDRCAAWV
jgi:acetoin utilization protein AcuC